jgi:hypothetical protein
MGARPAPVKVGYIVFHPRPHIRHSLLSVSAHSRAASSNSATVTGSADLSEPPGAGSRYAWKVSGAPTAPGGFSDKERPRAGAPFGREYAKHLPIIGLCGLNPGNQCPPPFNCDRLFNEPFPYSLYRRRPLFDDDRPPGSVMSN